MQWYYAKNVQQQGPVEPEQLEALARSGGLSAEDLVWNVSMGNQWAKASTVPGLFEQTPPVPPIPGAPPAEWPAAASYTSGTANRDMMGLARGALAGNWGIAIGGSLLYYLIITAAGMIPLLSFVINGPMMVGWTLFFLSLSRRQPVEVGLLFKGFNQFGNAFIAYLLMLLLVIAWAIPGIVLAIITVVISAVKGMSGGSFPVETVAALVLLTLAALSLPMIAQYRYSMTYFILIEFPAIEPMEAIRRSTQLMAGNKWKLFCMHWRFFGWTLLCIPTFGIGLIWLIPYIKTSEAAFYTDLKKN